MNLGRSLLMYHVFGLLALAFYFKGFFLTRRELGIISECHVHPGNHITSNSDILKSFNSSDNECWMPRRYSRVFFFIIDAMRLDFITYHENSNQSVYNNLDYVHHLLVNNKSQSMLYGFRGDPPTTTTQRLKGLFTGTLPTFIDFSANFNTNLTLNDDNVIDQIIKRTNNRKKSSRTATNGSIFIGDDTWISLFNDKFDVSIPYDSFNTRDIYTVDYGIESNLANHLNSKGWELFVAHFLGVDHVGHTYSAHDLLMSERLQHMNQLLKSVVSNMDDDTLLVLFGDHGMTDDGNHGGASSEETDSGVFFYSKRDLVPIINGSVPYWKNEIENFELLSTKAIMESPRIVNQVDLVPTISLLLGLPIPFSNIGSVIPELFLNPSKSKVEDLSNLDVSYLTLALAHNSAQVMQYFEKFFSGSTNSDLSDLKRLYESAISQGNVASCMQFLTYAINFGREKWTQYNMPFMTFSIVWTIIAIVWHIKSLTGIRFTVTLRHLFRIILCGKIVGVVLCIAFIHIIGAFSDNMIKQEKYIVFGALHVLPILSIVRSKNNSLSKANSTDSNMARMKSLFESSKDAWYTIILINLQLMLSIQNLSIEYTLTVSVCLFILAYYHASIELSDFINLCPVILKINLVLLIMYLTTPSLQLESPLMRLHIPRLIIMISVLHILAMNYKINNALYALGMLVCLASGLRSSLIIMISIANTTLCQGYSFAHNREYSDISFVIQLIFISRYTYFATNHSMDFNTLQLEAGFIGQDSFHFIYAGFMLIMNTVGANLLLLTYASRHKSFDLSVYLLYHWILVLVSMIGTFILRRHLMVWAIFAPKLVFESFFYVVNVTYALILIPLVKLKLPLPRTQILNSKEK